MSEDLLAVREAAVNELLDHTLECGPCSTAAHVAFDREDRCQAGQVLLARVGEIQEAIMDAIDETTAGMLAQARQQEKTAAFRAKLNEPAPAPGWSVPDPWHGESHYIRGWGQPACGVKAFYGGERFPAPVDVPCGECVPYAARDSHAR